MAHLKHGRRKTPCFVICFRLLLVRHGHQQKAGTQSTEHKSEDVTDQSRVAGTSARRVDEYASGSAVLDSSCCVSAFARKSWPSALLLH